MKVIKTTTDSPQQTDGAPQDADDSWRSMEIPSEILAVESTPVEGVGRLVKEVWEHCKAVQASALTTQPVTTVEHPIAADVTTAEQPLAADNAAPTQPAGAGGSQNTSTNTSPRSTQSFWSAQGRDGSSTSSLGSANPASPDTSVMTTKRVSFTPLAAILPIFQKGRDSLGTQLKKGVGSVRKQLSRVTLKLECTSCLEQVQLSRLVRLRCKHNYCAACFVQLVEVSMRTESMFPPRCCFRDIPHRLVVKQLSFRGKLEYSRKEKEYSTPPNERWYCPQAECGRFFEPRSQYTETIKCPHCRFEICSTCRGPAHPGNSLDGCPEDQGLQATLVTAEREGWQRCTRCRALVERRAGCRHMECRCGAQFCYVCGARWGTCSCTADDEARRAQQIQEQRDREQLEAAMRRAAAEEEEAWMRNAIAQVTARERLLERIQAAERERRAAEEAEALERVRAERAAEIRAHSDAVRAALVTCGNAQRSRMAARHYLAAASAVERRAEAERVGRQLALDLAGTRRLREVQREAARAEHARHCADNEQQCLALARAHERPGSPPAPPGPRPGEGAGDGLESLQQERRQFDDQLAARLRTIDRAEASDLAEIERQIARHQATVDAQSRQHAAEERQRAADVEWLAFAIAERARAADEEEQRTLDLELPGPALLEHPSSAAAATAAPATMRGERRSSAGQSLPHAKRSRAAGSHPSRPRSSDARTPTGHETDRVRGKRPKSANYTTSDALQAPRQGSLNAGLRGQGDASFRPTTGTAPQAARGVARPASSASDDGAATAAATWERDLALYRANAKERWQAPQQVGDGAEDQQAGRAPERQRAAQEWERELARYRADARGAKS